MKRWWLVIIAVFIVSIGLVACTKQLEQRSYVTNSEIIELIHTYEPNISSAQILAVKGSKIESTFAFIVPDTVYNSDDLIDFLAVYGAIVPDIRPNFVNFYQDIGSGHFNAKLDNLTTPDDVNCIYEWYVGNELIYTGINLPLVAVSANLPCEGLMMLKLKAIEPTIEAEFEYEQWTYIEYVFVPDSLACICNNCPNYWDIFPTPTDPVPYEYQTKFAKWDLDHNNMININDLLILLAYYG
jgi:hypothetical protein